MPKGSSKSTAAIERLLEERRQYEAWLARISAAGDAAPEHVRVRVRADYEARLQAVTEELKAHADAGRQLVAQRKEFFVELQRKEKAAAERLAETELRHAVGEYDEGQWTQVHKDALAELVAVREELQEVAQDIEKLEELDSMVRDAEAEMRRVLAFCGLDFEPDALEVGRRGGSVATASMADVRSGISKDRGGAWKPYAARLQPLMEALRPALGRQRHEP